MCASNTAIAEVLEDGARVRIVRYILRAGAETGWHRHDLDYVIVPYDDIQVRVQTEDGNVEAWMHRQQPYSRKAGAFHNVTSLMSKTVSFLEIEVKAEKPGC